MSTPQLHQIIPSPLLPLEVGGRKGEAELELAPSRKSQWRFFM